MVFEKEVSNVKRRWKTMLLSMLICVSLIMPSTFVQAAQTIYDNEIGTQDNYNYELWKDYGTTSMTLNGGGTFSCQWSNIGNALFRKGIKFDSTKTYQQIGNISIEYGCNYKPDGNSYLCVYGWTTDPLVEYYIVESWGTWRPPGATAKGQITVDGGTYDVYETTRVNQPSIQGDTTFKQYWSVRTSKRTSGTISVTEHFKAWENMGLKMGKLYEAALNVEGYQSNGSADVYKNNIIIGASSNTGSNTDSNNGNSSGAASGSGEKTECENMTITGQYAGKISSPFNGVALYADQESVKFNQYFAYGTHDFTLRAASSNSKMAKVDMKIGGKQVGTFYYGDEYPAEYTIKNVSHGTGNQEIELVVTSDDGTWDAYLDYLKIGGATEGSTGTNSGTSNTSSKMVALTFDDGPSSTTNQVLDILEQYDVVATFFLIGEQINMDTLPIMQRQLKMGCELANHSYNHVDMSKLSATDIKNQITWTSSAIKNAVDYDVKFFRPPYLATSNSMYQNIDLSFIQGISCNDWESSVSASQRANTILNSVEDGSIILLHDFQGNTNTVQALPTIIEGLKNKGYTFVTVSELFEAKGVNPNQEYKIWSKVE